MASSGTVHRVVPSTVRGESRKEGCHARGLVVVCLVVAACVQPTEPSATVATTDRGGAARAAAAPSAAPLPALAHTAAAQPGGRHLPAFCGGAWWMGGQGHARRETCAPRPAALLQRAAGCRPSMLAVHQVSAAGVARVSVALALAAGAAGGREDGRRDGQPTPEERGRTSGAARGHGSWQQEGRAPSTGKVVGGSRASAGTVAARNRKNAWASPAERHAAAEAAAADLEKAVGAVIAQWEHQGAALDEAEAGRGERAGGGARVLEMPSVVRFNKALKLCALDNGNVRLAQVF